MKSLNNKRNLRFACALWLLLALPLLPMAAQAAKPKKPAPAVVTPPPEPEPQLEEMLAKPKPKPMASSRLPEAHVEVIDRAHSLNLNVGGIATGDYTLTYQYMFAPGHCIVAEGLLSYSSSADNGTNLTYGGQFGYRWLWSGHQNSWFLGVMAGYDAGTNTLSANSTSGHVTTTTI